MQERDQVRFHAVAEYLLLSLVAAKAPRKVSNRDHGELAMSFLKQFQGHVLTVAFVLAAAPIDGCKSWKRARLRRRLRSQLLCRILFSAHG